MDSFFVDNVKAEKAIAMKRYQRFRKIADVVRYIFEICVVLMLFAWISTRLPATLCDIFRDFSSLFVSPRFMFVVGNAIILTLFVKSGQFSGQNSATGNFSGTELYDEFVKNSVNREKVVAEIPSPAPEITINEVKEEHSISPPSQRKEEIKVYEDKEILMEENLSKIISNPNPEIDISTVPSTNVANTAKESKKYQRSQSEKTKKREKPKQKELRRWKTERSREEEMSNEEFNRTIEAFIAKQVKFIREESMAIVTQN